MGNRVPDLPILGEPLLAEFANTLYVGGTTRLDVLDRPAWIAEWLGQAPCAADLPHPGRLRADDAAKLRVLRDAVRGLLEHRPDVRAADIEVINSAARPVMTIRRLTCEAGELQVVSSGPPGGIDGVVSAIAISVLNAVENETFDLHRLCDRPGCNLYYFRDHHRRRYCNPRCASADRQARYNARRAGAARSLSPTTP
jgi:predicted RNA-binding Zn ribbon-like protein